MFAASLVAAAGADVDRSACPADERTRRPGTLEDTFGDAGNHFQGGIGFITREANNPNAPEAASGYGLGIDDVVLYWREYTLDEDRYDCLATCTGGPQDGYPCSSDADCGSGSFCGGGSCATINLDTNAVFDGIGRVDLTVVDDTPSDNDCDLDGAPDEPPTRDCNRNGTVDVVVRISSDQESQGEIVVLDRFAAGLYRGAIAISSAYDVPGTLFVANQGNRVPTITVLYIDLDDGTGQVCGNSFDPESRGRIVQTAPVYVTPANVVVTRTELADNGDNDGWADDRETVTLRVEVANRSGRNVTGLTLRLSTNDATIACITRPLIAFGDLKSGETRFSREGFELIVGTVDRQDALADLSATLSVGLDADQFQSPAVPQSVTLNLDLDAVGGSGPGVFFESFENGFGSFTSMQIDAALNPPPDDLGNYRAGVINADDHRCQYSDPSWEQSASFGPGGAGAICFPGPNGAPDTFFWTTTTDRSFSGNASLYWGVWLDAALGFTTPTAQLEAIRTTDPVNLGWDRICELDRTMFCDSSDDCPAGHGGAPQACVGASPEVSWKHQISLVDHRRINAQPGRSAERGVFYAQPADPEGEPVGDWIKLVPYVNTYDTQANWNYFGCTFDPADDGSTEDDFFDPTDPNRFFGPSSTCEPNLNFAHQGETGFLPFSQGNLGDATDGPGLSAQRGGGPTFGTWIEPKIDLTRFRGQRMRFRFLATGKKQGGVIHWEQIFVFNPDPRDDGWFIDDFKVTDTLAVPATVLPDLKDNSDLAGCEQRCGVVGTVVEARPMASGAPGQPVEIDASFPGSTFDRCNDGVPEWAFWIDVDRDDRLTPQVDVRLRDYSQNPRLLDTPEGTTRYLVDARCSSLPSCSETAGVTVDVACPTGPDGLGDSSEVSPFLARSPSARRSMMLGEDGKIFWGPDATVDVVRGELFALREKGSFVGTGVACLLDNGRAYPPASGPQGTQAHSLTDGALPEPGSGFYYLARSAPYCNVRAGGSYGDLGEAGSLDADPPRRDQELASDAGDCPD